MALRVQVLNEREVLAKLEKAGIAPRTVLKKAMEEAAEVIVRAANNLAPGPHIEYEFAEDIRSGLNVNVGPDADHWYYRFFEFGVQPFVIDKGTGRSYRSGGGGRPLYGDKQALLWPGGPHPVAKVERGPMAAKPFLRPAIDTHGKEARAAAGRVIDRAIKNG